MCTESSQWKTTVLILLLVIKKITSTQTLITTPQKFLPNFLFLAIFPCLVSRSILLLTITITITFALLYQYVLAPSILHHTGWWKIYSSIPGMGKVLYSSWTDSCAQYTNNQGNDNNNDGNGQQFSNLYIQCVRNAAVFHPTFVSTLFFLISAIATKTNPRLNREAWPAKFGMYFILLTIITFVPNAPLLMPIYLTFLRIGAMIFIFIQQIILIDIAYN